MGLTRSLVDTDRKADKKSSVKLRRCRFCLFASSMVDTVSASHLVSTEADQLHDTV
jgi:hypothetical protein